MIKILLLALKNAIAKPLSMFMLGAFTVILILSLLPTITGASNPFDDQPATIVQNEHDPRDIASPQNYLNENQIRVYSDRVVIDVANVKWAAFKDTKSMLPVISKDANALQIEPKCPEEIKLGDIVSYESKYAQGIIIHRVVYIGEDNLGPYFILKGDNNPSSDPGKIRCEQIQRRVIGVLY